MCFAPEVDFTSSVVIGAVGVVTLTKARSMREVPLAALPLAFALHQFAEGFVWLGLQGRVPPPVGNFALHAYVLYAWALLPVIAPLGVTLMEPQHRRRQLMAGLVALGSIVSAYMLWAIVHHEVVARIAQNAIRYSGVGRLGGAVTAAYVLATCGTLLLSSQPKIALFGWVNLVAVVVIARIQAEELTSLWCTWAALVSVLIFLHFAGPRRTPLAIVPSR